MSWGVNLVAIIIGLVVVSAFAGQLSAFAKDQNSIFNAIARDNDVKIPTPKQGAQVYDLVLTVSPRWKNSLENILFLNAEGGTFVRTWQNPHKALSWLDMYSWVDLFDKKNKLTTYELIVPSPNLFGRDFKLSYVLVDPDTDLVIKIGRYQDIPYHIAGGVGEYEIIQKLTFKDVVKKDYELWIIPDDNVRFADHAEGVPYKQRITP